MRKKKSTPIKRIMKRLSRMDHILNAAVILLNIAGLIAISSITDFSGDNNILLKQVIGSVLGLVLLFGLSFADTRVVTKLWKTLYAVTIIMLAAVLIAGTSGGGARRWITFNGLSFQPSELAKILLILFYSEFIIKFEEKISRPAVYALSALLVLPPFFMILREPDLSTGIMILLIFCVIIFVAGLDSRVIAGLTAAAIPSVMIFLYLTLTGGITFLGDYQRQRILAWLHPEDYASSTAYQTMNSMTAIGSGQLIGKGLHVEDSGTLLGTGFISESQTDFIFAVIGEQMGFLGCCVIVLLILVLTIRLYLIANKCAGLHDMIIVSGMAAWIGFQSYLNIGVATGLLPNTGIPLPFVSYGLTSLVCLYTGLGLVQSICIENHSANNAIKLHYKRRNK